MPASTATALLPTATKSISSKSFSSWPWLASFLAALAVVTQLLPAASDWLQLDRSAVAAGQWWRLFTCHFSHWSSEQLLWNALAVWALAATIEGHGRQRLAWAVCIAAPAIALAVLWFEPQFATYRGLSGLASTLFVILALRRWHAGDRTLAAAALVGFALKIGWEAATGTTVFVGGTTDVAVLPISHVVGGLIGAVIGARG